MEAILVDIISRRCFEPEQVSGHIETKIPDDLVNYSRIISKMFVPFYVFPKTCSGDKVELQTLFFFTLFLPQKFANIA